MRGPGDQVIVGSAERRISLTGIQDRREAAARAGAPTSLELCLAATQAQLQNTMTELTAEARDRLRKSDFAYVGKEGEEHLPIHDEEHVRNAMARWNQTKFESATVKESTRKKILQAAKQFRIEVSEDVKVMKER